VSTGISRGAISLDNVISLCYDLNTAGGGRHGIRALGSGTSEELRLGVAGGKCWGLV